MTKVNDLVRTLSRAFRDEDFAAFREECRDTHPAIIAEILEEMSIEEIIRSVWSLDTPVRMEVFRHLPPKTQRIVARRLKVRQLADLVTHLPHDIRVDLLQRVPRERVDEVLALLPSKERDDILHLASYDRGTVGAIMTTDYAALSDQMTAGEAIESLRAQAPTSETIYNSYVTDEDGQLVGRVLLRNLILADPKKLVADIMRREIPFVKVTDSQEEAARLIRRYDLISIPVVSTRGRLLGIVTFDDALDVAEAEQTEDMHKMASMGSMSESLREASPRLLVRKRLPWLLTLVGVNIFAGAILVHFEATIEQVVALVFFLPLLIDSAGNAGSQAATLMVRSLATGDVKMRDWFSLLRKEVFVSVALGMAMAAAVSVLGVFRAGPDVALVVAVTMLLVVIIGSLIGMSLPFLLQKLRLDPATASAPLITSLADISGVLIYFTIATWYLGIQ